MQKAAPDYGMQINPISRLIQIQQAKKEKEPIYTFIGDRGQPRKREFVIQVSDVCDFRLSRRQAGNKMASCCCGVFAQI